MKSLKFAIPGAVPSDVSKKTYIDAGDDYIMRIEVEGSDARPNDTNYETDGPYWAEHAEFNPKITPAALTSIKAALNRTQGQEHI